MQTNQLFRLDGQIALVTGGYGLFGKPISEGLLEAGATVVIAARSIDKIGATVAEFRERGLAADAMELDLSDEASIRAVVQAVIERYGKLDILVNNAVARGGKKLEEETAENWERIARVNSTGLFLMCKEVVPHMREQGGGNIINIASIQGAVGPSFHVYEGTDMTSPLHYTFEKWGMVGLTKYLANFYGPQGIRVNCISPGGFYTDQPEPFLSNYNKHTPLGRMADEIDMKGPIVFMASEASRYITGHNLMVDGGWTNW
ncbi:MAG: SDR family oxidoreductase [Paenibacillaceae bacterium]|nr:SDR family oxidoreductase [Paenibacillaceae bacterium]